MSLKPRSATIQPVTVVPMFAPKIMPSDSEKVRSPAPTKPTAATVVALEERSIAVVIAPVTAPLSGLRVKRIKAARILFAPKAFSPSVMTAMPNKNRPNPPAPCKNASE